ncbi:acyl-CoA thioesterase domain-containing protein [Streptomyces sp. NPDC059897]|uniref:acyl-CoA thioesterase domain-containing protein n=1 Tax=Streptomyces sp. NPDC059897 TaxID=3346994 RepID=UPI0036504521
MAQTEDEAPYFTRNEDTVDSAGSAETFVPESHARGWWAPGTVHGRLLGGLLARALEREHAEEGLHFARLTVDLFRTAPFAPVGVTTQRVRDGRRIRVADAVAHGTDGRPLARASAVLLRTATPPPGHIPATGPWDAPPAQELLAPHGRTQFLRFDEELRPVREWSGDQRRRSWMRDARPLVGGEALSPLVRAALAADTASPLAHAGDDGLRYINADYTLSLSRLPLSDEIGLEATGHTAEDGIAVGHCTLYDAAGPIGYCTTTALANPAPDH